MSAKVEVTCKHCGRKFMARVADRARGWARFCSKSCKAIDQTKRRGSHKRRRRPVDYDELGVGEISGQWD